jgi:hypothetical protein
MQETNTQPYDRDAIFHEDGPFHPTFIDEAVRALMRTLPLDSNEPRNWCYRRMYSALTALAAVHARDEIEVMLGVQALSGMNQSRPNGDNTRHFTAAASAARAFDSMLRAIERRQAKPLAVPIGRPAPRTWSRRDTAATVLNLEERCRRIESVPEPAAPIPSEPPPVWSPEDIAIAEAILEKERIEKENEGLDIANTEGILPCGGMILTEDPTPQQKAYMGRRLKLMYQREYREGLKKGITKYPEIRGIRPGDLIP